MASLLDVYNSQKSLQANKASDSPTKYVDSSFFNNVNTQRGSFASAKGAKKMNNVLKSSAILTNVANMK